MRSIDADGHGSDGGHGLLQGALVVLSHVNEAGASGADGLRLETADAVLMDGGAGRVEATTCGRMSGFSLGNQNFL